MDQTIVTRNYFTDEGDTLVIGGKLIIEDGAEVEGLDGAGSAAENQSASTATAVAALKNDFNALLIRLKNAGIMDPDEWSISTRLAPALTDPVAASNNGKASATLEGGVLTVTADVDELGESESSAPGQGTHKWIGLGIGTGRIRGCLRRSRPARRIRPVYPRRRGRGYAQGHHAQGGRICRGRHHHSCGCAGRSGTDLIIPEQAEHNFAPH